MKRIAKKPKRRIAKKPKDHIAKTPKEHVLSFRVDITEWKLLQKASRKNGVNVSTLLRRCVTEVLKDSHV